MAARYRKGSKGNWEPTPSSRQLLVSPRDTKTAQNLSRTITQEENPVQSLQQGSSQGSMVVHGRSGLRRLSSGLSKLRKSSRTKMSTSNPRFDNDQNNKDKVGLNRLFAEQQQLTSCILSATAHLQDSSNVDDDDWESQLDTYVQTCKSTPPPENDPPLDGIRLRVLQSIRDSLAEITPPRCRMNHDHSDKCKVWTNGAVYMLLKKFTHSEQCSVGNLLRKYPGNTSGPKFHPLLGGNEDDVAVVANVFVSHTWSTSFPAFVESLERHVLDDTNSLTPDSAYFWICGLIINEHAPPASENFALAFLNGVEVIPEVVCVLESWRNPVPLTRVWCLWEIMGAIQHNKPFSILFTKAEEQDVKDTLVHDFEAITSSLCKIDAEKAGASVESDKVMILNEISKLPKGILGVNQMILLPLRNWIAETCESELLQLRESAPETVETLLFMNKLALLYRSQSEMKRAEELHVEVLEIAKRVLGVEEQTTAIFVNNLAGLYRAQGRLVDSETLYAENLRVNTKLHGKESPFTLQSMNNLALLYYAQGKVAKAEPLYVEALELRKKIMGVEHPHTLSTMNNLGELYRSQGQFAKAEPLYLEAKQVMERVLGEDHPSTLTAVNNLAEMYEAQGRYSESEPLYLQNLSRMKRVLGEQHANTLMAMNNLASLYESLGRYAEAEPLYKEALAASKELFGLRNPSVLTFMNNLGSLYESQGRLIEAEQLYSQTVTLRKEVLGLSHPLTLSTMRSLAGVYESMGRFTEGEALLVDALNESRRAVGDEHDDNLQAMFGLAEMYVAMGRPDDAERMYNESINLSTKLNGREHSNTQVCIDSLSDLYVSQGRFEEAVKLAKRS